MTIRIGANPIAWSNDDMQELGADISLETCLAQAKAAGFEGMELGHKFPRTSEQLKPILDKFDLNLVGGWYSTHLLNQTAKEEFNNAKSHIRLLKDMGCSVFIMAEVTNAIHGNIDIPLSKTPMIDKGNWSKFTTRMDEFSMRIRDMGFLPAYHHHMGTVIETAEEIDHFMTETSEYTGLLIDAGHATFAGIDPIKLAQDYSSRITHVHCKDIRKNILKVAKEKDCSFLSSVVDGIFTVPGDGNVDFPGFLNKLSELNYSGWLVVEAEQDPKKADPETYANMGYSNLYKMAKNAGFTTK